MKTKSVLAVVTALVTAAGPGSAAGPAGPDGMTEAARLAAHAQVLEDQCQYRDSAEWLGRAIATLRQFRTSDLSETQAAGSLLAQLEIHHRNLKDLPSSYDRRESAVEKMMQAHRLESASRLLRQVGASACETRFTRLEDEVARRQAESRGLVRQGHEAVRRFERKAARNAFERAQAVDVEAPGLIQGMEAARAIPNDRHIGKVVGALVILGVLAGGGYYAYRDYERRQALQAATLSPHR